MTEFKAKRIERKYCQTINADPDTIFPLLCPVREAEWLDGWAYKMIWSESGLAEEGCVFSTPSEGEPDTVWVITKQDRKNHVIEFVRFTPDSRTCVLKISVVPISGNKSNVRIAYTYTGISDEGNRFVDEFTEDKFLSAVKFWEASMNHYLETGKKLGK